MNNQEKQIFYNDMIVLFKGDFISSVYLNEICLKNSSKEEKLLELKDWMKFEKSYIENNYTSKEYKRFQNIYNKICKMLENKEVDL